MPPTSFGLVVASVASVVLLASVSAVSARHVPYSIRQAEASAAAHRGDHDHEENGHAFSSWTDNHFKAYRLPSASMDRRNDVAKTRPPLPALLSAALASEVAEDAKEAAASASSEQQQHASLMDLEDELLLEALLLDGLELEARLRQQLEQPQPHGQPQTHK